MSQNDNNFVNGTGQAIVLHKQINPKKMSQVGYQTGDNCPNEMWVRFQQIKSSHHFTIINGLFLYYKCIMIHYKKQ